MNTKALIQTTIEHPKHCNSLCKKNWVTNLSSFAFSSGEYIKWNKITAASKNLPWSVSKKSQGIKNNSSSFWIGGKHYIRDSYAKDLGLFATSPTMYQDAGLIRKNHLQICADSFC